MITTPTPSGNVAGTAVKAAVMFSGFRDAISFFERRELDAAEARRLAQVAVRHYRKRIEAGFAVPEMAFRPAHLNFIFESRGVL